MEKELWVEVFDEVVKTSTWGSSKAGGPVWVMDFRFESLKALCPDSRLIKIAEKELSAERFWLLGETWAELAEYYIRFWEICNVMVIFDAYEGTRVHFYSLLSFINLLNSVLGREEEKGAPLSEISYILDRQSKSIEHEDYIWRTEWKISDNFLMKVKVVDDWEIYIPNIIYDLMELLSKGFFDQLHWHSKLKKLQYPMIQYWNGGRTHYMRYGRLLIVERPKPQTAGRCFLNWHSEDCFKPKCYWKTKAISLKRRLGKKIS